MQRDKASFFVSVAGQDITTTLDPVLIEITVQDSSGDTADTATIVLDDKDGQISFPNTGDPITIALGWANPVVVFEGTVDDVDWRMSRLDGRVMSIPAKSADHVKGKLKHHRQRHKDKAKLGDVAQEWGKEAGLSSVDVHPDLASIERDWWGMNNESFQAWGQRIAKQFGATFKVMGTRAVIVPRNAGVSTKGVALPTVYATYGDNLLSVSGIKPNIGRPQHKKFRTRHHNRKEAKWEAEEEESGYDTQAEAEHTSRWTESDAGSAKHRSRSHQHESDRDRGGGTVEINGEPSAQAEATCILSGARPGIDGTYRIDSVEHRLSRSSGFTTRLTLKQPEGAADKRASKPASGKAKAAKVPASSADSPTISPILPASPAPQSSGIGHA